MTGRRAFHDRYGLSLSTSSGAAAQQFGEGLDRFLSMNAGVEEAYRAAIAADESFALAHAAHA